MSAGSRLSRRALLRGMGTMLALPLLPSLRPRAAWATDPEPPPRFVHFYGPNGAQMTHWTPTETGPQYTLTRSLTPLASVRDDVLVLSGLDNVEGPAVHTFRSRSLLSERLPDGAYGARFGRSLDQVLIPILSGDTRFPSLPLGSEPSTACGTAECGWLYNVSWADEHVPVTKDISPQSVFDRLFGGEDPEQSEAARQKRMRLKRSVLDAVLDDVHSLQPTLSTEDRPRLERYLDGIRSLERDLETPPETLQTCDEGSRPVTTFDPTARVRQMLDLMVVALECDQTRVISYMLGAAESYRSLTFLGHYTNHHTASHNDPVAHLEATTWCVEQYAYLLQRLAAVSLSDGSRLLDHTHVLYASGISDAAAHDHVSLPVLLGGRTRPTAPAGQHVSLPPGTPMANLCVSLLQAHDASVTRFGEQSTGSALDLV